MGQDRKKAKASANVRSVNADLRELEKEREKEDISGKLFSTFKSIQDVRKELISSYKNILFYRNIVGQNIMYSGTAGFYAYNIQKQITLLENGVNLFKVSSSESQLNKHLSQLQKLIAMFYEEQDKNKRVLIYDQILDILGFMKDLKNQYSADNILPSDIQYNTSTGTFYKDADNVSCHSYFTFHDDRKFKIFYGKIKGNRAYIAQQATICGVIFNKGDTRLYLSVPIIDMNYVGYKYTKYAPLDFWPINKWWTDYRFISERYQIDNPDAKEEDQSDQYKTVYSILYFNGSRFFGSDNINYNSIYDGDTDRLTFLAESSNSNHLTGNVKYTREIGERDFNIEFSYEDSADNPSKRGNNNLSDALKVEMKETNSRVDPFVCDGTLSYDSDLSYQNGCTAYTGTLNIRQESQEEISDEYSAAIPAGSSIDVICYVKRLNANTYNIDIVLDPDSTSNQSKLETSEPNDIISISIGSGSFKNVRSTNQVTIKTAAMQLLGALTSMDDIDATLSGALDPNSSSYNDSSTLSSLLSDMLNNLSNIANDCSKEITGILASISGYISTYQNVVSYMSTNDPGHISQYLGELNEAFATMKNSMEEEAGKSLLESDLVSVCKDNIEIINSLIESLIVDARQGISDIEFYMNNYGPLLPEIVLHPTIETSIKKWVTIVNGRSMEKSAYSSMGSYFFSLPLSSTYDNWKINTNKFVDNETYIYPITYLLYVLNILLRGYEHADHFYATLEDVFKIWYKRKISAVDIFTTDFINLLSDKDDLYDKYKLIVDEDINRSFINPSLTNAYPEISFFNNIDLSELITPTTAAGLTKVLSFYKVGVIGLLMKHDRDYVIKTIEDIYSKISNIRASLRDYVFIYAFMTTVEDIITHAKKKDSLFNKILIERCKLIVEQLYIIDPNTGKRASLPYVVIDKYIRVYKSEYGQMRIFKNNASDPEYQEFYTYINKYYRSPGK